MSFNAPVLDAQLRQSLVTVRSLGRRELTVCSVAADRVNIDRLGMLHPSLRARIEAEGGIPVLSHWFESSVPGLYFVGITSLRAFGPLFRFVAGCGAAHKFNSRSTLAIVAEMYILRQCLT